ncbi:unnamed protein product, partial [marine sediment metagenome]
NDSKTGAYEGFTPFFFFIFFVSNIVYKYVLKT